MGHAFIGLIGAAAVLCASTAMAQTARDIRGPAAVVPLASEPAPRIVIDPPLADWLADGRVVIQYRAENLRIVPDYDEYTRDERSYDRIQDFSGVRSRVALRHSNMKTPPLDAGLYWRLRDEPERSGAPMRFDPEAM